MSVEFRPLGTQVLSALEPRALNPPDTSWSALNYYFSHFNFVYLYWLIDDVLSFGDKKLQDSFFAEFPFCRISILNSHLQTLYCMCTLQVAADLETPQTLNTVNIKHREHFSAHSLYSSVWDREASSSEYCVSLIFL